MRSPKSSKPDRARRRLPGVQTSLAWDPTGLIAGVDEAGRGPLAGPVVAAAVILDDTQPIAGLADSKALTALRRERLFDEIRAKALCCSIAQASVEEIDRLNILQATMLAMQRAVEGLRLKPVKVLVDGNRLPTLDILAECTAIDCARSCTRNFRSTDLSATRAMAHPSTCRPCAITAPARSTGAVSRLWPRPWWLRPRKSTYDRDRTDRHFLA
jgi:hypothetical protein